MSARNRTSDRRTSSPSRSSLARSGGGYTGACMRFVIYTYAIENRRPVGRSVGQAGLVRPGIREHGSRPGGHRPNGTQSHVTAQIDWTNPSYLVVVYLPKSRQFGRQSAGAASTRPRSGGHLVSVTTARGDQGSPRQPVRGPTMSSFKMRIVRIFALAGSTSRLFPMSILSVLPKRSSADGSERT